MFSKNKRIKKLVSMIMVIAMIFSAIGAMSLSAFATVGDNLDYLIGGCIKQHSGDGQVPTFGGGMGPARVYIPISAKVIKEVNDCFIRYGDNLSWAQRAKITKTNSVTYSLSAIIPISIGDEKNATIQSTFGTTESVSEEYNNTDLPSGVAWRLVLIGCVKLVEITYEYDYYNIIGYKRADGTVKGYALLYLDGESSIVKAYKPQAATSAQNIKFFDGKDSKNKPIYKNVNYIKTSSNGATLNSGALLTNSSDVKSIIP
jgi:hypothetical protein